MLGYILSHDAKLQEIQNAHNTSRSSQKKTHRANQKKIDFFFFSLKWALRDSFLPAWGVCNLSWGCCRYSSPRLSLFKMQTLRRSLSQLNKGFVIVPAASGGKGSCLWFCCLPRALFALGIFLGSVNIGEEMIRDLRKGVGERDFWGRAFKAESWVPCRTQHLNKAPPF